jgi:predicted enzyme involved in methoxymalonyl-ACP biosynthesis
VAFLEYRFGSYGLIGVAAVDKAQGSRSVVELPLPCRAMGRHVERAIIDHLASLADKHGATDLVLKFQETERNGRMRAILEDMGFKEVEGSGGRAVLSLKLDGSRPRLDAPWLAVSASV